MTKENSQTSYCCKGIFVGVVLFSIIASEEKTYADSAPDDWNSTYFNLCTKAFGVPIGADLFGYHSYSSCHWDPFSLTHESCHTYYDKRSNPGMGYCCVYDDNQNVISRTITKDGDTECDTLLKEKKGKFASIYWCTGRYQDKCRFSWWYRK